MQRVMYIAIAALFVLAGCNALESEQDKKVKAKLIGTWLSEYRTNHEEEVREVVSILVDGQFRMERVIANGGGSPSREMRVGSWYLTDGLYKLRTEEIDDKKLSSRDYFYFTCKIESLDETQLLCKNNALRFEHRQTRVPANYTLSYMQMDTDNFSALHLYS